MARLSETLRQRGVQGVTVVEEDLYSLVGEDLDAALDGVAAGDPSPFVVIAGGLVCTGTVDVEKVLAALNLTV